MEKRAVVLALALTIPLVLYGIPYAYASTTSSTYTISSGTESIGASGAISVLVPCNTGDYATGGGFNTLQPYVLTTQNFPFPTSGTPTGWLFYVFNTNSFGTGTWTGYVVCQTPITVAGIGIPQFGSLYIAIALGAVVYFVLSRRYTNRPTISAQVEAKQ